MEQLKFWGFVALVVGIATYGQNARAHQLSPWEQAETELDQFVTDCAESRKDWSESGVIDCVIAYQWHKKKAKE